MMAANFGAISNEIGFWQEIKTGRVRGGEQSI